MSEHLSRECKRLRERLPEYAEDRCFGAPHAAVERHLKTCTRCTAEVADLRAVIAAAKTVPQEDPPEHLVARVQRAVQAKAPAAPRQFWLRLAVPAAVLTGLVAVSFAIRAPHRAAMKQAAPSGERGAVLDHRIADAEAVPGVAAAELDSLNEVRPGARPGLASGRGDEVRAQRSLAFAQTPPKERSKTPPLEGGRGGEATRATAPKQEGRPGPPSMAREEAWSRERLGTREAKKPEAAPALRDEVGAVGGLAAGPAAPSDTPAPAEEEARELSLTAEAPASAVPPAPSISAAITVVKGGSGQNLLALRLSGQRPIRELTLQFGEAAPTAHEWRGAPGSPALIPLPGERIGTGPAAVPVTVATEEGRRQYTLFLPTLARLGESASQAPVGRWQAVAVDQALLDLSTFTGLVILAEQPLSDRLCGDIPTGTPEEALQQVAAEAGFEVHQDGPLAYTLTHAR